MKQATDSSNVAVLKFDRHNYGPFDSTMVKYSLTDAEIREVGNLVDAAIHKHNDALDSSMSVGYGIDTSMKSYKYQYIAVLNPKGERLVWVNAFCDSGDVAWRTSEVFVFDGGNCYFNLMVNLSNKTTSDFSVNGYA